MEMIELRSEELLEKHLESAMLCTYLDEVQKTNQLFNLYSRNLTINDLKILVAESLLPLEFDLLKEVSGRAIDIGSGWGIPSIPLMLAGVPVEFGLVERTHKKADFLTHLISKLGLKAEAVAIDLSSYQTDSKVSLFTVRQVAIDSNIRRKIASLADRNCLILRYGLQPEEVLPGGAAILNYSIDGKKPQRLAVSKVF